MADFADGQLCRLRAPASGRESLHFVEGDTVYRDEETARPVTYYAKFPPNIADGPVILVDPMLATGGSAAHAVTLLKQKGCRDIRLVCLVAAPEGIAALHAAHPDLPIHVAAVDERLNERFYIVPGLGDAGDRIFGTQ